jgi:hypothetical protein
MVPFIIASSWRSSRHHRKPQSQDELQALIEEARRRARRRRLAIGGVVVGVLVVAGVLAAVLWPKGDSSTRGMPEGFHAVQARGPVRHIVTELRPAHLVSIDVATGAARSVPRTTELWYDARTKLYRLVDRVAGRPDFDVVGAVWCQRLLCLEPGPIFELAGAPRWPLIPKRARLAGSGTYDDRRVVWVEPLLNGRPIPGCACTRWALDARTHEPIVQRNQSRPPGTTKVVAVQDEVFSVRSDLPAAKIRFAVPEGGAPRDRSFPSFLPQSVTTHPASLGAAEHAVDHVPLWLGRSFEGHRLRRIQVGTDALRAKTGRRLLAAPVVQFDYGPFTLKEYGSTRPWWYLQGPRPGRMMLEWQTRAALARGGLLVVAEVTGTDFRLDRAAALRIGRGLRPAA